MTVIISVKDQPDAPPSAAEQQPGYRASAPPSAGARRVAQIGTKFVEFLGDVPPTQAEVDAFLTLDALAETARGRVRTLDDAVVSFSFGGKTLSELKAMDNAEFDAWWAANITTLAQANAVLKLLSKAALHRLL